eukprot:407440-Amphidinium_carterae.1
MNAALIVSKTLDSCLLASYGNGSSMVAAEACPHVQHRYLQHFCRVAPSWLLLYKKTSVYKVVVPRPTRRLWFEYSNT